MSILQKTVFKGHDFILFGCDVCGDPINQKIVEVETTITTVEKDTLVYTGKTLKSKSVKRDKICIVYTSPAEYLLGYFGKVAHMDCGRIKNKELPSVGEFLARADKRHGPIALGDFNWRASQ